MGPSLVPAQRARKQMLKRILMNQVDASPGNGAAAPTTAAPADPTPAAQSGTPITMTKEALDAFAASIAEQAVKKASDSFHASRRRESEGKGDKPTGKQESKNEANTPADDPSSLLALRDAFDDATSEMKLTKGQKQLLRDAVMTKRPSDVDGFCSDFASRAGWSATAPTTTVAPTAAQVAAPQTPQQPRPAPVSDRGSPPVVTVPLEEQDLLTMSPGDRDSLRKLKGDKWFTDKVTEQSRSRVFKLR